MKEIPIHTGVAASMHPQTVRGDAPGAASARNAMAELYLAEGKIRDLHGTVHNKAINAQKLMLASMPKTKSARQVAPPLIYDRQLADMVVDGGTTIAQTALRQADRAIASLGEMVANLDAQIETKIMAGKNPARGAELRAWVSNLQEPFIKLSGLFAKAAENPTLVAEVLGAEHFLSGITVENQALLRTVAAGALAPEETAARKETHAAHMQLEKAGSAFTANSAQLLNSLSSPDAALVAEITNRGNE